MNNKTLSRGLVAGATIVAGSSAYADVNAVANNPGIDLGQVRDLSPGFLFPVPVPVAAVGQLGADRGFAKLVNKYYYTGQYSVYEPWSIPPSMEPWYGNYSPMPWATPALVGLSPCGASLAPMAALTALSIGAMGFRMRRRNSAD